MPIGIPGACGSPHATGFLLADGVEVACTIQCVHCGVHFLVVHGSGKTRGYCLGCGGPHCGGPNCWRPVPHISYRKKLELHERDPAKNPL